MKHHLSLVALALALATAGCSDSTSPSVTTGLKFTAVLLPSNETPPITNADQSASGTVTITMNNTKDSSGNITASKADFQVALANFPAGTTVTGAHIHTGVAGTPGGIVWNLALTAGEITLPAGATTFTKTAVAPTDVATAQAIINNPSAYYFNVHTVLNGGGAVRGQLVPAN